MEDGDTIDIFTEQPCSYNPMADPATKRLYHPDELMRETTLRALGKLDPAALAQHALAVVGRLAHDEYACVRLAALLTLGKLERAALAEHADVVVARLEDSDCHVRREAVRTLGELEPATLAQHADAVLARLEHSNANVRVSALEALGKMEPGTLALHAHAVDAMLADSFWQVRFAACETLSELEPAALAQHAGAVLARLDASIESVGLVRQVALSTLGKLEPVALAQHANAVLARLDDNESGVIVAALETLCKLGPKLGQHVLAVVAMLHRDMYVSCAAFETLGMVEPAALAQHAEAAVELVLSRSSPINWFASVQGLIRQLPRFITCGVDPNLVYGDTGPHELQSRLLRRLWWYRCRLRLRVQRLVLYWYALPYRPSGPGHARDVEAWDRMVGEGEGERATQGAREGGRRKKLKEHEKDKKLKKKPAAKRGRVRKADRP